MPYLGNFRGFRLNLQLNVSLSSSGIQVQKVQVCQLLTARCCGGPEVPPIRGGIAHFGFIERWKTSRISQVRLPIHKR